MSKPWTPCPKLQCPNPGRLALNSNVQTLASCCRPAACWRWQGVPRGREGQQLQWVGLQELPGVTLTPADVPLLPHVLRVMGGLEAPCAAGHLAVAAAAECLASTASAGF